LFALSIFPALAQPAPADVAAATGFRRIAPDRWMAILGRAVHDPSGKVVGRLVDVLVDETGQTRAAVIDFGGFLGVGSRKVAVDWTMLQLSPSAATYKISLNLSADQIKATPEYKDLNKKPLVVVGPPAGGSSSVAPSP
jgi:hypothetical protein